RQTWAALETLLARSSGQGVRALHAEELDDLGRRYRQVMRDLAVARRDFPHDQLTASLNDLAARTHMRLYQAPSGTWPHLAVIFTNNIRVAFFAFAGGVLAGLGTLYVLVANGVQLGAVLGAAQHYGVAGLLLTFISAHGYLELTMIVISGAAGLRLGDALLRP